jgi:hypothetical protein
LGEHDYEYEARHLPPPQFVAGILRFLDEKIAATNLSVPHTVSNPYVDIFKKLYDKQVLYTDAPTQPSNRTITKN